MLAAVARSRRDLAARQTTSGDRVDVRLVLRHPTLRVRASKRRLRRPRTEVAAGMARLRGVRRIHEPNRNPGVTGFVLDTSGKTRERPIVESAVHPLAVVEMLTDVRQIFEKDNGILEGTGVLNGFAGCFFHDIRQSVLVVVEPFVHAPLGVSFLEPPEGGEHLLADLACPTAIVDVRPSWSLVPTGTASQEFGFTDVEADRRRVVRLVWFRDLVLNSDVKHPVGAVLLQSELSDRHATVEQVRPERFLSGVDAERNPEGVATSGLRDAPAELVRSVLGVIETPSSVREPNRMIVVQLGGVVRPAELRDVVLDCVLRVGREIVVGDDIVDRRLGVRTTLEGLQKSPTVCRHGTLKSTLFIRRRWRKRGFERFRGGGSHNSTNEPMQVKTIVKLSSGRDAELEHRSERRRVRPTERSERRTRPDVARTRYSGREGVGHRGAAIERGMACTNAIPPRRERRGFLATAR